MLMTRAISLACLFFSFTFTLAFASSSQLKVVVLDPESLPVAGAQLSLYAAGKTIASQNTSGTGAAVFTNLPGNPAGYTLQVLAPGFSPQTLPVKFSDVSVVTVHLSISAPGDTVVVSATRAPVSLEESGASVSFLNGDELAAKQSTSAGDALRFVPGTVVSDAGQRGGLTSLFVRGGESRYNKVIVDGVPVNDPGGTFDFGVVPMQDVDRLELTRGAESTLYGSDAMTSVVQLWTSTGHTRTPQFDFGADGGNFSTAHGFASLSGARGRFDYNLFADQFNTSGHAQNDDYSNALQGGNLGITFSPRVALRLRTRHSNSRSGVQNEWDFNGQALLPPDIDQFARNNDFLSSAELTIAGPSHWEHRLTGFEYNERRLNLDSVPDRGCDFVVVFLDCPFLNLDKINRAGLDYQADYSPRSWARSTLGYEFEDENGFLQQNSSGLLSDPGDHSHPTRRNHALYGQQFVTWRRFSVVAGLRYVWNASFGQKAVPHAAVAFQLFKPKDFWSGTRLRFAYGAGIKEPRFEESFGLGPFVLPNPGLQAEQNRSLEAGIQQDFAGDRYTLSATYFNNLFTHLITFQSLGPPTFAGEFVNLNRSFAHGSELELRARPVNPLSLTASYVYTSTQILSAPLSFDPLFSAGAPLLRRPRHSGSLLATYTAKAWSGQLGGTFVGRRPDSDFFVAPTPITHSAGYARFDIGGWRRINRFVTAYANIENLLNKHYEDVVGYPALGINVRAGLRLRIGGE
jgi:outer membrane cobalamin receptor